MIDETSEQIAEWQSAIDGLRDAHDCLCRVQVQQPFGTGFDPGSMLITIEYVDDDKSTLRTFPYLAEAIEKLVTDRNFEIDMSQTKSWDSPRPKRQWLVFPVSRRSRR